MKKIIKWSKKSNISTNGDYHLCIQDKTNTVKGSNGSIQNMLNDDLEMCRAIKKFVLRLMNKYHIKNGKLIAAGLFKRLINKKRFLSKVVIGYEIRVITLSPERNTQSLERHAIASTKLNK